MLAEMPASELTEWMAYERLDPFGSDREDLRAATVACTVANSQGGKTKPADFMPDWRPEEEKRQDRIAAMRKKMMGLAGK